LQPVGARALHALTSDVAQQETDRPVARDARRRRDVCKRTKDERACMHARMRQRKLGMTDATAAE
jgi:hypothetical protein